MKPLLSKREAAALLHVHVNTLGRWTTAGAIKAYRIGGRGDLRYDPDDLEDYLSSQRAEVDDPPRQVAGPTEAELIHALKVAEASHRFMLPGGAAAWARIVRENL